MTIVGGTFTVEPLPVTVTVTGSQTYGGQPEFSTTISPADVSLPGNETCDMYSPTSVQEGSPIPTPQPVAPVPSMSATTTSADAPTTATRPD